GPAPRSSLVRGVAAPRRTAARAASDASRLFDDARRILAERDRLMEALRTIDDLLRRTGMRR
ncbi:MAG TPA: hypothetical protein VEI02_12935, partial [Planctomycetota bacterium]|nr:hypothetical protein [Planctomycetota bacterium]